MNNKSDNDNERLVTIEDLKKVDGRLMKIRKELGEKAFKLLWGESSNEVGDDEIL